MSAGQLNNSKTLLKLMWWFFQTYPYGGINMSGRDTGSGDRFTSSHNGALRLDERGDRFLTESNVEMQIDCKCFAPPSSSQWGMTGRELTTTTVSHFHTIQWKRLQITITLCRNCQIISFILWKTAMVAKLVFTWCPCPPCLCQGSLITSGWVFS